METTTLAPRVKNDGSDDFKNSKKSISTPYIYKYGEKLDAKGVEILPLKKKKFSTLGYIRFLPRIMYIS